MSELNDRISALITPIVASKGVEVFDVEFSGGNLRITLDRPEGLDLALISELSESISAVLDAHDPMPNSKYILEVTSPGLERTLRTPPQYKRFVGSTISVKTRPETEGERRIQAELESADEEGIVVGGRRLDYDEIERARTVFEWKSADKPGKSANKSRKKVSS